MRVLTVGAMYPPHARGGYERVWAAWVDHLRRRGDEVTVLTTDHREPGVPDAPQPGVHRDLRWYWRDEAFLPLGPLAAGRLERHNARAFARHADGADVVAWFAMGGMSLGLVSRTTLPQLAVVHDAWPSYGPQVDRWSARWGRRHVWDPARIAAWSVNSAWVRDGLGLPASRTHVDHPGVDPAAFGPSEPRPDWGGRLVVLGRVEPRKGVEIALEALPKGMSLEVAGPAAAGEVDRLRPLATGRDVTFSGPQADPAAALTRADAVLFPVTWDEPFGLVPLEAMAVGRPVLATGTGGSAEYLRDGENCLLVAPGDAVALRNAVERLAGDSDLRACLVAGGRRTAARHTQEGWCAAVTTRLDVLAG